MIEEERYIIEVAEESVPEEPKDDTNRFPVKAQLLLIGGLLLLMFTGFVVPQTLALLGGDGNQAGIEISSEDAVANVAANTPKKIESVNLTADAAYVFDVVGQRVLYEKNADSVLPLASITKLMTALVAYELVPDNTRVTITEAAAAQQSGGGFVAGESFEVKELADYALISSFNSASYALAVTVGTLLGDEDPLAQFVAAMNITAEELNLPSLDYRNPTGLDISLTEAGAYGTARDTSFLMEHILKKYPEILTPTVEPYTRLYNTAGDFHEAYNTNSALAEIPNLLGSKTGYTDLAGGNLTIAFDAGYNRPIIITVLGSTRNERFADVKKLVSEVQKSMSSQE